MQSSETIFTSKSRYTLSSYEDDSSTASFLNFASEPCGTQAASENQILNSGMEGHGCIQNSVNVSIKSLLREPTLNDDQINHLDFLASEFPGFATESLRA